MRPVWIKAGPWPAVLKMLAKAPEDRYPTWADLALDLANTGRLSVFQQAIPDREKFSTLRSIAFLEHLSDGEIWELVHAGRSQHSTVNGPLGFRSGV